MMMILKNPKFMGEFLEKSIIIPQDQ